MNNIRKTTNTILELIDDGLLDPIDTLHAALMYMSEDEVADMVRANELFYEEDEEE